jgi:hypothetical protein
MAPQGLTGVHCICLRYGRKRTFSTSLPPTPCHRSPRLHARIHARTYARTALHRTTPHHMHTQCFDLPSSCPPITTTPSDPACCSCRTPKEILHARATCQASERSSLPVSARTRAQLLTLRSFWGCPSSTTGGKQRAGLPCAGFRTRTLVRCLGRAVALSRGLTFVCCAPRYEYMSICLTISSMVHSHV